VFVAKLLHVSADELGLDASKACCVLRYFVFLAGVPDSDVDTARSLLHQNKSAMFHTCVKGIVLLPIRRTASFRLCVEVRLELIGETCLQVRRQISE
jgi:hypothetical protein